MQITCTICSDLFVPVDTVVATSCGHLFHHQCLIQWLERSKSCPQCRAKSNEKSVNRIFFNIHNASIEDTNTLQNKIDSLEFKILLKDNEMKTIREELVTFQKRSEGLKGEVKRLKQEVKSSDTNINTLKEQFNILKARNKELEPVMQRCEKLQKQVDFFKNIETVVKGTSEEVDDMLNDYGSSESIRSLLTFTSVLKKEMQMAASKKKELNLKLREAEARVFSLSSQIRRLQDDLVAQRQENEHQKDELSHVAEERASLQHKVHAMEQALVSPSVGHPSASALKRLLAESPAPSLLKKERLETPEEDKQTSDSPYLNIKSSAVGLTPLRHSHTSNLKPSDKFSIFRKARINSLAQRSEPPIEESYDGLGGHSKPDFFPKPLLQTKMKRTMKVQPVSKIKLKDASKSLKMDHFLKK